MRTLASQSDHNTLITRLASVSASDTRRWGRMNVYQMLRHLGDAIRVPLGEKQVSDGGRLIHRTLTKWGGLWVPIPWPKSFPSRPELDQCYLGIFEGDFEAARQNALTQLARLRTANVDGARHPYFGDMRQNEWMRWGWLHTDHHLRQFGR